jgi:hypothetical protein
VGPVVPVAQKYDATQKVLEPDKAGQLTAGLVKNSGIE